LLYPGDRALRDRRQRLLHQRLTRAGLAVLRLDRLRSLVDVYPGVEREDDMVTAFDFCLHGKGGAAPSIDTAMHGLVDAPHLDHLHPDSGIALATAADGRALTEKCFGGRVAWVDWRRPGFQLGLDIAKVKDEHPEAIGVVLGGHGITAWGDTSQECEANSLEMIRTAERFLAEHGTACGTEASVSAAARPACGTDQPRAHRCSHLRWPATPQPYHHSGFPRLSEPERHCDVRAVRSQVA